MGQRIGAAIMWVIASGGCRDVEETSYEPSSTTSTSDTGSETSTSEGTGESSSSESTGRPHDFDSATTSSESTTGGEEGATELVCGEGFTFTGATAAPLVEIDDRRIVETLELTVRVEHPAFAGVEIAIVKDDMRRVLFAPGSVDCGGELSLHFSDEGRLHAEDACSSIAPDDLVLPAESLDVFAGSSLAGAWTLEASGAKESGAITAWCLVVRSAR
jgi:hypothetical protein